MSKPKTETKENTPVEIIPEREITEDDLSLPEDSGDVDIAPPPMSQLLPEQPKDATMLIPDDKYLNLLDEIADNIREDRKQVSDYIDNMADMVINDGDPSSATKEALVNLVKVKTDLQDKMVKIADLMTRLKSKNTYAYSGAHLNAVQQNNYNIGANQDNTDFNRRELIRAINQAKKKKD